MNFVVLPATDADAPGSSVLKLKLPVIKLMNNNKMHAARCVCETAEVQDVDIVPHKKLATGKLVNQSCCTAAVKTGESQLVRKTREWLG